MGAIERFLKQKDFISTYEKAHVGILCASSIISDHTHDILKKFGITLQQYNALRILRGQHPEAVNLCVIKERLIDRNSDTSRLVERLRKMELVERVPSIKDRRAVDILISPKGLTLLDEIEEKAIPSFLKIVNTLSEEEVKLLTILLDKIVAKSEELPIGR